MTTALDSLPLLTGLSPTQRAAVAGVSTVETYAPGHRLFDEGGVADRCWVVLTGCVMIDHTTPGSGRVALQSLGHGELVGWSWAMPPHRWHFGATVVSPTRAVVVDAVRLRELADADPELGYRVALVMLETLVERLQTTRIRLLDLQRQP
ncbi:Cyclic nucleotide-binding domain-containing protein [Lentzea waywayandensis]|uniref:Cyclic nucleotide-binding domain-containing protein n=1 Tax=Lentzea waywayandensis TaxID=84724 RepID=A0A1I6DCE0_9PSEU|nr:cyclic nucleotide-binding domain-containing protein [Lentzea waywayandensis]SFR03031.1 Cyclic nucleotide-binding domain-containing protein [Lentzea waywayandensis]